MHFTFGYRSTDYTLSTMDGPIGFGMSKENKLCSKRCPRLSKYCQPLTNYCIYHKRELADAIMTSNINFDQVGHRLTKQTCKNCEMYFWNNRKIVQSSGNSLQ